MPLTETIKTHYVEKSAVINFTKCLAISNKMRPFGRNYMQVNCFINLNTLYDQNNVKY